MLGGSYFQVPAIKYAKEAGYYVITCDYLPNNPGHVYADEYYNISTTDLEGVLNLAVELKIDGIVAYASDPAAPTAAYVSEKLGLPGNSYECVKILTEKDLFRDFLKRNNFNVPFAAGYRCYKDVLSDIDKFKLPVMIKPVDSSGSKGVKKVISIKDLKVAFDYAMSFSRGKRVVVEEYINKKGCQIGGDGFVVNRKLVFLCLGDQFNNEGCNPFVPVGMIFPSTLNITIKQSILEELQKALTLLGFEQGAINVEVMLDGKDNIYIMEIGPRSGGNCIPEIIKYSTCFDSIKSSVDIALGNEVIIKTNYQSNSFYLYYAIHSRNNGILKNIEISPLLNENILEKHVFKNVGDEVNIFNGSNATIGILLLQFSSDAKMKEKIANMDKNIVIVL